MGASGLGRKVDFAACSIGCLTLAKATVITNKRRYSQLVQTISKLKGLCMVLLFEVRNAGMKLGFSFECTQRLTLAKQQLSGVCRHWLQH